MRSKIVNPLRGAWSGPAGPSPAEAVSGALGEVLGDDVDRGLPVEPFQVHDVGAVERPGALAAEQAQQQRVAGRQTVQGEVEALELQLGVEAERQRDAAAELGDQ